MTYHRRLDSYWMALEGFICSEGKIFLRWFGLFVSHLIFFCAVHPCSLCMFFFSSKLYNGFCWKKYPIILRGTYECASIDFQRICNSSDLWQSHVTSLWSVTCSWTRSPASPVECPQSLAVSCRMPVLWPSPVACLHSLAAFCNIYVYWKLGVALWWYEAPYSM